VQYTEPIEQIVKPENCDLAACNYYAIWTLLTEHTIFAVQHNFYTTLPDCPLDGRDQPVTANAPSVILMEKGVDTTLSCQFAAVQSAGV